MVKGTVKKIIKNEDSTVKYGYIESAQLINKDAKIKKDDIEKLNLKEGDSVLFEYKEEGGKCMVTSVQKNKHFNHGKQTSKSNNKISHEVLKYALRLRELSTEEYDKFCDLSKDYVSQKNFRNNITTSKIRNIFSEVQKAKEVIEIKRIRPNLAYLAGRDNKTKFFMNDLDGIIKKIDSADKLKSFQDFFEAIICYKKELE